MILHVSADHLSPVLPWVVVILASGFAAISDLRHRCIRNVLTGPLLLSGLLWNTWRDGWQGLGLALSAAAVLALPYIFLFLFARGGAGDAKMMAAIGAWLGLVHGMIVLAAVSLAGVMISIGYSVMKKQGRAVFTNILGVVNTLIAVLVIGPKNPAVLRDVPTISSECQQRLAVPYGIAILTGVCCAAMGVLLWHK